MAKPKIFIGSSVEGLTIAYAVQQNLTHDAEITVWDQGVFELSQTTIESLVSILEKCDFAIFVFSPDDILKIRKKEFLTVRDNVIFELGLFIGKLGRQRTFIVMPDKPIFHIPTDLLGITAGKYDTLRTDGSYQAATGPVSHQIRTQIKKLGLLQSIENETASQKDVTADSINENQKETDWWSLYFAKKYKEALELIEKEIEEESEKGEKTELSTWKIYVEYKIDAKKGKEAVINKIKAEPDDKYNYSAMSRILLWENELSLALNIIDEGLAKFKDDEILISRKSEYLSKIGKNEQAIDLILSTKYQDNEELSIKLADLYESLEVKKLEDAFSVIKIAYNNNPSSEQLTFKLARLAQDTSKDSVALYLLDILTKKDPKNVSYWGYLGNSCVALGLTNKAMVSYRKAQELSESKEVWILENIGNILNNQGFYTYGREYFNKALVMDTNSEYSFDRVSSIIKNEDKETEKYLKLLKEGLTSIVETKNEPAPNSAFTAIGAGQ